jgi:hypothetical protein
METHRCHTRERLEVGETLDGGNVHLSTVFFLFYNKTSTKAIGKLHIFLESKQQKNIEKI